MPELSEIAKALLSKRYPILKQLEQKNTAKEKSKIVDEFIEIFNSSNKKLRSYLVSENTGANLQINKAFLFEELSVLDVLFMDQIPSSEGLAKISKRQTAGFDLQKKLKSVLFPSAISEGWTQEKTLARLLQHIQWQYPGFGSKEHQALFEKGKIPSGRSLILFARVQNFSEDTISPEKSLRQINLLPSTIGTSVSSQFAKLSKEGWLMSQTDARLGQRGLLVNDGGLCATTSAYNAFIALLSYGGYDLNMLAESGDRTIERVVDWIQDNRKEDARIGYVVEHLREPIDYLFDHFQLKDINYQVTEKVSLPFSSFDLTPEYNQIFLSTWYSPNLDSRHAMNILGFNALTNVLTYSDPYSAQYILQSQLEVQGRHWVLKDSIGNSWELEKMFVMSLQSLGQMKKIIQIISSLRGKRIELNISGQQPIVGKIENVNTQNSTFTFRYRGYLLTYEFKDFVGSKLLTSK